MYATYRIRGWGLALLIGSMAGGGHANTTTATLTSCQAHSTAAAPTVVELYTSEGCSSCPPADRWLSSLVGRRDVLALAFHVHYWDRLGWPDRFATPQLTERQYQLAQLARSQQVYTPQVVLQGKDWRAWRMNGPLPDSGAAAAPVQLSLTREGAAVVAKVTPAAGGAPTSATLSGYWAVLEDGHSTRVRAGENAGSTLRHDHVVRHYEPVAPWSAASGTTARLVADRGAAAFPRRVAFVVTDPQQRPLQALSLAC